MAPGRNRGSGRGRGRGHAWSLPVRNGDARQQRDQNHPQNNASKPKQTEEQIQARSAFFEWQALLSSDPSYDKLDAHRKLARFWASALGVLNNNFREWHQWLAKDLVSDELSGLKYVRSTINFQAENETVKLDVVRPFLEVITHHELLNCLSIEAHVGTIYSFICGSDGTRAVDFITSVCQDLLILATKEPNEKARHDGNQVLRLLIEAIEQLLEKEMKARLNDNLGQIFDLLDRVSVKFNPDEPGGATSVVTPLRRYAGRCARLAKGLAETQPSTIPTRPSAVQSTFPLQLSRAGGRHDNDHEDITKIRLLPTTAEIMSNEAEYLPSTNWTVPHVFEEPVQRHLDTHFRLLRHDTFGPINMLLHGFMLNKCSLSWLQKQETRAHAYSGAHLNHIFVDKRGLGITLSFLRPADTRKLSLAEQRKWWESSSRLDDGVLVAFVVSSDSQTSVLFFTVAPASQDTRGGNSKTDGEAADGKVGSKSHMLVPNQGLPQVAVKLVERTDQDTKLLLRLYDEGTEGFLIEFPSIIPATFAPILRNLQTMIGRCNLAFSRWILPMAEEEQQDLSAVIPPPEYARASGFKFRLDTITTDRDPLELDPSSSLVDNEELFRVLESRTGLDRGQCEGLAAALTREYALIQGPPGTGKSYVGVQLTRALLACKSKASLGPIMVICYTNHALDQFLQHLMEVGIDKVIRIGGRSRVLALEGKNLRAVSMHGGHKTKLEQMIVGRAHSNLETYSNHLGSLLGHLHPRRKFRGRPKWDSLRHFLKNEYRSIYNQLSNPDKEGFITRSADPLAAWLHRGSIPQKLDHVTSGASGGISQLIQRAEINIDSLTGTERQALVVALQGEALDYYSARINTGLGQMEKEQQNIKNAHQDVDLRVLRQADIIGVTTTGLARDIEMLRLVGSKVVICEEAAEVLEAHLLSAMMPRVQHLIQIGDHQQLRPQVTDYDLSLESSKGLLFQLNRSQFERRAVGEPGMASIPLAKLNIQRRARPEISRLYRIPLYPGLKDHEDVLGNPNVVGMRRNLFWLEHDHQEDKIAGQNRSTSKTNRWEVDMVVPLVRHLVRQGSYSQSDIAVLTPYAGQLRNLRKALSSEFDIFVSDRDEEALAADSHGKSDSEEATHQTEWDKAFVRKSLAETLRLATVDNFQGEEAKIIIISLVRSNPENKVGFLRTSNRINVLLSRARYGMYIIGNSDTYLASGVQMWRDVYQLLQEEGNVGRAISLCCDRHKDTPIECSTPEDFHIKSPEGGCALSKTLKCGHRCPSVCGEECREGCCHECRDKEDSIVDYIEFKTYAEIDVNETPIVVLSCGHIFTAESLDGHVGMHDVYVVNQKGEYTGEKDISSDLAKPVPGCPECRRPILQFSTKRYNRVINRAVMDETTKRLLAKGRTLIKALETEFCRIQEGLQKTRDWVVASIVTPAALSKMLNGRHDEAFKLIRRAKALQDGTRAENQPTKKLGDAINQTKRLQGRKDQSDGHRSAQHVFTVEKEIFYSAAIIMYQMQDVKLRDTVSIRSRVRNLAESGQAEAVLRKATSIALQTCARLVSESMADKFPRASVQLTLCYANMTKALEAHAGGGDKIVELADTARALLGAARRLCNELRFDGAPELGAAVEDSLRLFEDRYEAVTAKELDDIKSAMVSGPGGIATHSGHWYKCQNGHPFAIGECGMPMELARCPECGANIGGQNHSAVAGVERASEME
ncbi:hypothetical protein PpBr36_07472 [Pyricularia pennisetigena]|uniref:hypothetical protein n=1 Tax=Pyricularia pennisetigena TaxID=1578925 RepID=UPI00114EF7C3|nr:hypothetical protein PpBr36_07472 [Pyricularia pennisetigena]TLS25023.1 hypothetical protein PpBr36_07472 [Pyricularia pennisetigena]